MQRVCVQGELVRLDDTRAASNGVIHYYLLGPMEPANGTVADVIKCQSDLSTLRTAVQTAGLVGFLIGGYLKLFVFTE